MFSTSIGKQYLCNCIMNSSGIYSSDIKQLEILRKSALGGIVSKSSSLNPMEGNSKPNMFISDEEKKYSCINSVGCANNGYEYYLDYGISIYREDRPYIQSLIFFTKEELETMLLNIDLNILNNNIKLYNVELNFSCPNILDKSILGYNTHKIIYYCETIRFLKLKNIQIGIKLPIYYNREDLNKVGEILLSYRDVIKFITLCNTIPNGLMINSDKEETLIYPNNGYGGISGIYNKPLVLSNINQFYNIFNNKISIIGCGGILNGKDAFEAILSGADCIQIGTLLLIEGVTIVGFILKELKEIMKQKGYYNIKQFKGKLKITSKV